MQKTTNKKKLRISPAKITCARYGHRDLNANPENQYRDISGNVDQKHGCNFFAEDFARLKDRGLTLEKYITSTFVSGEL